jgi:hypothetical protein
VDVAKFVGQRKPVLVVPRYRLEAWQAGERMPAIFQDVFESHGLREPPWGCWSVRKGASKADIVFWIERRGLKKARSKKGKRIYGEELSQDVIYELRSRPSRPPPL